MYHSFHFPSSVGFVRYVKNWPHKASRTENELNGKYQEQSSGFGLCRLVRRHSAINAKSRVQSSVPQLSIGQSPPLATDKAVTFNAHRRCLIDYQPERSKLDWNMVTRLEGLRPVVRHSAERDDSGTLDN